MGGETTQYDVALRYVYKDGGAQKGVESLAHQLDGVHRSSTGLGRTLAGLGGIVAGAFGVKEGVHAFVGFNAEMQDMKITMTALTQANLDEPFELARKQMDLMVDDFTQFAKQSPLTTKEVVNFAEGVEAGVFNAKGSLEDFKEIAEQGALAAKMLGADANYAGVEIQEMLQGSVRKNMRFARNLMGFAGIHDTEEFNAKSDKERLELVKKALSSPAMKDAGKQFEQSFTGVTSTFKDQMQLMLGGIGLPLFKAITTEVRKWNEWIEKNPDKIRQFAADFTNALMEGFRIVKEIAGFIVEHQELLMMLAKAYLAGKAVGFVSGGIQGLAGALSSLGGTGAGSLGAFGLSLGGVTLALSGLAGVSVMVAESIHDYHDDQIKAQTDFGVLNRGAKEYYEGRGGKFASGSREERVNQQEGQGASDMLLAKRVIDEAQSAGLLLTAKGGRQYANRTAIAMQGSDAGMSSDAIRDYISTLNEALGEESRFLKNLSPDQREKMFGAGAQALRDAFSEGADLWSKMTIRMWGATLDAGFSNKVGTIIRNAFELIPGVGGARLGEALKNADKGTAAAAKVNVTIQRIEVQDTDPDRFVFGLSEIARKAVKNPSGARSMREG